MCKTFLLGSFYDSGMVAKGMQIANNAEGILMKYRQIWNQHPKIYQNQLKNFINTLMQGSLNFR